MTCRFSRIAVLTVIAILAALKPAAAAGFATHDDIQAFVESAAYKDAPFHARLVQLDAALNDLPADAAPALWAEIMLHKIDTLANLGDYDRARQFLDDIWPALAPVLPETAFYIDTLYRAAFIRVYAGDIKGALVLAETMKESREIRSKPIYQQYTDNILVAIYTNIGNSAIAARILIDSYESGKASRYPPIDRVKLLANIGYALASAEDYEAAERYLATGRRELERASASGLVGPPSSIQAAWHLDNNLATALIRQERYLELAPLIERMKADSERLGSPLLVLRSDFVVAAFMFGKGEIRAACVELERIIQESERLASVDLQIDYRALQSKALARLGRYKEALEAHLAAERIEKRSSDQKLRARAEFMDTQLQLQKTTMEVERLEAERAATEILRKRERLTLGIAIAGLLVTSAFASLLLVSRRRLTRTAGELKESEHRAREAARTKSAFLANMSHEIRTPLNGLMGMAQILSETRLDQRQAEAVDVIVSSGDLLLTVVNDVLDLSKIEAGKMAIDPAPTDIRRTVHQLAQLWKSKADEKRIALTFEIDDAVPPAVLIDAVRVRQCLSNLLSNAIKFTAEGRVSLSVSYKEGDEVRGVLSFAVRDTGVGIPAQARARLFSAFEQADSSTTRRFGGTGLGLAITAQLAGLMGGGVEVDSEEGEGSLFVLTVAASPATPEAAADLPNGTARPAAQGSGQAAMAEGGATLRVLLVDDNQVNRMVARAFMQDAADHIVDAENGAEALQRLADEPFDLMLLDMHMPVMDGPATVEAVRAAAAPWRAIPIITLTADAMAGDRERFIRLGTQGYLPKPIVKEDLLKEIARVMAEAQDRDEAA